MPPQAVTMQPGPELAPVQTCLDSEWGREHGADLRSRMRQIIRQYTDSADAVHELELALGEAFANAVEYEAYAPGKRLALELAVDRTRATLELRYPGNPFTLADGRLPASDSIHGRGIVIMKECTDHLAFKFKKGVILVQMIKYWP